MNNKIKSKTRLAAIQLVSQHLINNQNINIIKDDFDKYYRNTKIDNTSGKIEYNSLEIKLGGYISGEIKAEEKIKKIY